MSDRTSLQMGIGRYPDEAFMFYGLTHGKSDPGEYDFAFHEVTFEDLLENPQLADFDVCTTPIRAYADISDRFDLLASGGRFGDGHGPILAGRESLSRDKIKNGRIAVPGRQATATLLLQLYTEGEVSIQPMPHERILDRVTHGDFTAGLVVDESFLTVSDYDLTMVVDFGEWWKDETGLPVPMGGCAIKSERSDGRQLARVIRQCVSYSLDHAEEALTVAAEKDPGRDPEQLKKFVHQYVNDLSRNMEGRGRKAIQTLLNKAYETGIIDDPVNPVFIQAD
jgi:1,4-dihydroxy-6-naphthoate synthase